MSRCGWAVLLTFYPILLGAQIQRFDFEDTQDVGREPENWIKVIDPAQQFFSYTKTGLAEGVAHRGKSALQFSVLRGNIAYESKGYLAIDPDRSYVFEGWIKTEGLEKSQTSFVLKLYEKEEPGALSSEVATPFAPTRNEPSGWKQYSLMLNNIKASVRFVKIRCQLLGEDISGNCWFDDIVLIEQPRIMMETGQPLNLFEQQEAKPISISITGMSPGRYESQLRVVDMAGEGEVRQQQVEVNEGGRLSQAESLDLKGGGRYRVEYLLHNQAGELLARQEIVVGVLPPPFFPETGGGELGVVVNPFVAERFRAVSLLKALRIRLARLQLWYRAQTQDQMEKTQDLLDYYVDSLGEAGFHLDGIFGEFPEEMCQEVSAQMGIPTLHNLLSLDSGGRVWSRYMKPFVARYVEQIEEWQLGADGDVTAYNFEDPIKFLAEVGGVIRKHSQWSRSGFPVPVQYLPRTLPADPSDIFFSYQLPATLPDSRRAILALKACPVPFKLVIELADSEKQGVEAQLSQLAHRYLFAREAGINECYVANFQDAEEDRNGLVDRQYCPQPGFYCVRTLNHLLAGARFVKIMQMKSGVTSYLFRRGAELVLSCWSDAGNVDEEFHLGNRLMKIDLMGNTAAIPSRLGKSRLVVTPVPVFLTHIDSQFLDTQLSLTFLSDKLFSVRKPQEVILSLRNQFAADITGTVSLLFPDGWQVSQRDYQVNLRPGDSNRMSVSVQLPHDVTLGPKEVKVQFIFSVKDGSTYELQEVKTIKITTQIEFEVEIISNSFDNSLQVITRFVNHSARTVNLNSLLNVPGRPLRERLISGLKSGQTQVDTFTLNGYAELKGQTMWFGIREDNGEVFLNKEVAVP